MIFLIIVAVVIVILIKQHKSNEEWRAQKNHKTNACLSMEQDLLTQFAILDQGYSIPDNRNTVNYANACRSIISTCCTLFFDANCYDYNMAHSIYNKYVQKAHNYRFLESYHEPSTQTVKFIERYDDLGLNIQETISKEINSRRNG